jgi:hypothetical protein
MIRNPGMSLLALLVVLSVPAWARAEVVVQTPVGTFVVGRPAPRCAPGVHVQVGGIGVHVTSSPDPAPVPVPPAPNQPLPSKKVQTDPPVVSQPVPVQRPQPSPDVPLPGIQPPVGPPPALLPPPKPLPPDATPAPSSPTPSAPAPLTLQGFADSFQASPGTHEVFIIHPSTRELVKVTFTLPEGTLKRINVGKREIDFDYGNHSVGIRFRIGGRVSVSSN